MGDGYIMLSRKFFSNKIWLSVRTFSEAEAWLDLIYSARYETSEMTLRVGTCKTEITWRRGQYPASIRFLTKKWGWSIRKVKSFLKYLQEENMIEIDDTQGVSIITLLNFDKYNYNPIDGTPNGTLNLLKDSELNQKAEHQTEQVAKKRNTCGTNTNKDIIISSTTTSRAYMCACEENFFVELRKSQIWLENMCMRFHLSTSSVVTYIDEFELECKCKGHIPENISDLKRHFHDWLRIQIQKKQKHNGTTNIQKGLSQLSERLQSKLPPEPGCGLIED